MRRLRPPRLPRPGLLVLAALSASGGLALLAGAAGTPQATPADAALFEGQGDVRMTGLVDHVRPFTGSWQGELHRDGAMVPLRGDGTPPQEGDWVEAEGRIARSGGRLTLLATLVHATDAASARQSPTWAALAQDAAAWDHRPLTLKGWIEKGELRDHDGHAVRLAVGDWPAGPATVQGFLAYDAGCLCHRLNGHVAPASTPP